MERTGWARESQELGDTMPSWAPGADGDASFWVECLEGNGG